MPSPKSLPILLAAALAGGCATLTDTNQQTLDVHAVQDSREIGNVGCVLTNRAGRWFVNAPGHVTVTRSAGPLSVDCKKGEVEQGYDVVAARLNASGLWGNLVVSAGLGYLVDWHTGAGYDYPATLTVLMQDAPKENPAGPGTQPDSGGNAVY